MAPNQSTPGLSTPVHGTPGLGISGLGTPGLGTPGLGASGFGTPCLGTPSLHNWNLGNPSLSTTHLGSLSCYVAYKGFNELVLKIIPPTRSPLNYSLLGARLSKLSSRSKIKFVLVICIIKDNFWLQMMTSIVIDFHCSNKSNLKYFEFWF